MTTSLVSEHFSPRLGAPDRISFARGLSRAGWDRPLGGDGCQLAGGGSPAAKVRGASGRGLLGRVSRQRGVLALGLVVGALGKPYASAQTGRVMLKPEFFMF